MTTRLVRDRDLVGRPRNGRPRDGLGRPLPRGHPGVDRVPDKLEMPLDDAIALADEYLVTGSPFHAHEVLEALWKSQPSAERDLWQGLAQVAVGLTHGLRGNAVGAATLLRRGSARLREYPMEIYGIPLTRVMATAQALADLADGATHDLDAIPPAAWVIRLR